MMNSKKKILLVKPLGFCSGVRRALDLFDKTVSENPGQPIYVLHELVHNKTVSEAMREKNARFVEKLEDIPDGAVTVFGAHGVGETTETEALRRKLHFCNAVCPLVAKLQHIASSIDDGIPLILFGDVKHPEVRSVLDRAKSTCVFPLTSTDDIETLPVLEKALFLCQTTLDFMLVRRVAALLKDRIPGLLDKAQVCDAVSRRQRAMASIAPKCDLLLVVGSPHSSNGRRMLAIAQANCEKAILVENCDSIDEGILKGVNNVGLGSATSTPDDAIEGVLEKLRSFGYETADDETVEQMR